MDPREWLFDKRVMRRNLEKKIINSKDYEEYLASLKDMASDHDKVDAKLASERRFEAAALAAAAND